MKLGTCQENFKIPYCRTVFRISCSTSKNHTRRAVFVKKSLKIYSKARVGERASQSKQANHENHANKANQANHANHVKDANQAKQVKHSKQSKASKAKHSKASKQASKQASQQVSLANCQFTADYDPPRILVVMMMRRMKE